MLASMIFLKEPFFHGQDNYDQVKRQIKILQKLVMPRPAEIRNIQIGTDLFSWTPLYIGSTIKIIGSM